MTKVLNFSVVNFEDTVIDGKGNESRRQIILLYALGQDGVIYEMSGGKWLALPIEKTNMRLMPDPPVERKNNDA